MYESSFVESPFSERVDGVMCTFSNLDFIKGVKEIAIGKGYDLDDIIKFISKNDGWIGVYGEYCTPADVITDYEEESNLNK